MNKALFRPVTGIGAACLVMALALPGTQLRAREEEKSPCGEELEYCLRTMMHKLSDRGWVGIEMDRKGPDSHFVIKRVIEESPAQAAGLQPGDELVGFNGIPYSDKNKKALEKSYQTSMVAGNTITYTVLRKGERHTVKVNLVPIPHSVRAQWIGYHAMHYHGLQAEEGTKTAATQKP